MRNAEAPIMESKTVEFTHVYPLFGREHEMSIDCWCHPTQDDEEPTLILHNVEN